MREFKIVVTLISVTIAERGFSHLDDELEFLDFLALLELNGWHDRLSSFSLYNPNHDKYFNIISIEGGRITYEEANLKPTIRTFDQIRHWLVIIPDNISISDIKPILDDYLSWRIHLTYCTSEGIILQARDLIRSKNFSQKATTKWKQDRLNLIQKIDAYILREPDILQNFLEKIDIYNGLQIYKFEHSSGTIFVAKTNDYFRSEIMRLNVDSEGFNNFYQSIDNWILENDSQFRSVADVLASPLLSESYCFKARDAFHFKSYFRQVLIFEFSCSGEFQECSTKFLKKLEKILLNKVLNHKASYDFVAQSISYGPVLQLQYFDLSERHHIKINLGNSEVFSGFGEGKAEAKIRSYIGETIEKHPTKFKEIFEKSHSEFKQEKIGPFAPVSITYAEKSYVRMTHCWNCKNDIDSLNFALCDSCSGIICFCGACLCAYTGY